MSPSLLYVLFLTVTLNGQPSEWVVDYGMTHSACIEKQESVAMVEMATKEHGVLTCEQATHFSKDIGQPA